MHAFTDLALAAYCPRKLYYRNRTNDDPPDRDACHELAFRYSELLFGETELATEPIEVTPIRYRRNLGCSRARIGSFEELCDPPDRDVFLTGRDARGVVHKVIESPLAPSIVTTGSPPDSGVYAPQTVRAVAAAKALAWERETSVDRAYVEYATHGVIREIGLTARRVGIYRHAMRTAASIEGPPKRTNDTAKCESCEYRQDCGVKTRSLRSLLR